MKYVLPLSAALVALSLPAVPAFATCPAAPDHIAAESDLLERLATARSAREGQQIAGGLWELYLDAPDAQAQALLDEGMALRRYGDFRASIAVLDELVVYCPDYAEGWNQRAFTHYLGADFEQALSDLERALVLSPRHVPAMSGKALTLIGMGRGAAAQKILREALDLNPWLPERAYLVGPKGEDI